MKKIFSFLAIALLSLSLVGCNYQVIDTTYDYSYAVLQLPDGTIVKGEVQSWKDYSDGDQVQVVLDGVTYLIHSTDCVLVKE